MLKILLGVVLLTLGITNVYGQTLDQLYLNRYNPLLSGSTCTDITLQSAITAIGSDFKTVYLTRTGSNRVNCTWFISNNVVVPQNVYVHIPFGVLVSVANGITLTFNGPVQIDSPDSLIGDGAYVFKSNGTEVRHPYAVKGCLPSNPVSSTTLPAFSCEARLKLGGASFTVFQESSTVGPLNLGNANYWVAIVWNKTSVVAGWTRHAGTRYVWRTGLTKPYDPDGGTLLFKAVVSGGLITQVNDFRNDNGIDLEIDLSRPLWGAVGDNVTDDTAAIQGFVNNLSNRDHRIGHMPAPKSGTCYAFTKLWFNYDEVNNINASILQNNQGRMIIYGGGSITDREVILDAYNGTCLRSTHAVGPAITFETPTGFIVTGSQRLELRDIHVEGNNTAQIAYFKAIALSRFLNFSVNQKSVQGGGVKFVDSFLITWQGGNIFGPHGEVSTAIGLHILMPTDRAGSMSIRDMTSRNWLRCFQYGEDIFSSTNLATIQFDNIQGKDCAIAMLLFEEARALTIQNSYFEKYKDGISLSGNSRATRIVSNHFNGGFLLPNKANLWIGDDRFDGPSPAAGVTIANNSFVSVPAGTYGIYRRISSVNDAGTLVQNNYFVGAGTYIALDGGTSSKGLIMTGNHYGVGTPFTAIGGFERVDYRHEIDYIQLARVIHQQIGDQVELTAASTTIQATQAGNTLRVNVTGGTATLTSMDTNDSAGTNIPHGTIIRLYVVIGSSDLVLTNNTVFKLDGAANKTLGPRDSIELMRHNAEWVQVGSVVNN